MDQIIKTIGDAIGGFFDNPVVQFSILLIVAYGIVLWFAAAFWAFRDMQLRSENPVLPYLAAALIILFNALFPFAVIVYRIIRPQEKIAEIYERNLAEEALLAEVEAIRTCPSCHRRINDEWIICPTCRTRLSRVCANCGRLVGLDWSLCAWCGKDFERNDLAAYQPISSGIHEHLEAPAPARSPRSAASSTTTTALRQAPRSASGGHNAPGQMTEP